MLSSGLLRRVAYLFIFLLAWFAPVFHNAASSQAVLSTFEFLAPENCVYEYVMKSTESK
jgi:hypothetical protein